MPAAVNLATGVVTPCQCVACRVPNYPQAALVIQTWSPRQPCWKLEERLLTKLGVLGLLLLAGPLLPSKDTLPWLAHRAVLVEHVPQVQLPRKALHSSMACNEHLPEGSGKACRMKKGCHESCIGALQHSAAPIGRTCAAAESSQDLDWCAAAPCTTGRQALLLCYLHCWELSCLAVHHCHVTYREAMQAYHAGRRHARVKWHCRGGTFRQLACSNPRGSGEEAGSWVGSGWEALLKAQPCCRPTTWCPCNLHPGKQLLTDFWRCLRSLVTSVIAALRCWALSLRRSACTSLLKRLASRCLRLQQGQPDRAGAALTGACCGVSLMGGARHGQRCPGHRLLKPLQRLEISRSEADRGASGREANTKPQSTATGALITGLLEAGPLPSCTGIKSPCRRQVKHQFPQQQ